MDNRIINLIEQLNFYDDNGEINKEEQNVLKKYLFESCSGSAKTVLSLDYDDLSLLINEWGNNVYVKEYDFDNLNFDINLSSNKTVLVHLTAQSNADIFLLKELTTKIPCRYLLSLSLVEKQKNKFIMYLFYSK